MKKRWITIMITLLLAAAPVMGQVIYLDEDVTNQRQTTDASELGVIIPLQDKPFDQWDFLPLGEGVLLLLGMGGAYFLAKKRRE